MIEIKPATANFFRCPECSTGEPFIAGIEVHSIYTLGDCKCRNCELEFYQTLAVGHCINDHVSVRKSDGKVYPGLNPDFWLIDTLTKAHRGKRNGNVSVRKIVHEARKEVIVLNTLDYLYGHVLLKLFNYQHHLRNNPGVGLVVIVPKSFEWLVPAEASEAWIVDLSLGELAYEHQALSDFFNEEFKRFDRIWFSMAWSHPDLTSVDIKRMTGIAPFNLEFYTKETPAITFVLREDRWWLRSPLGYWLYRAGRRFKNLRKAFYGMVSGQQERLVHDAIDTIRKKLPEAKFYITGIGEPKGFEGLATDARSTKVNEEKELEWCRIYSHSHVVVGFHGSNMLLPTAFSAGCVEILPEDRYGNILQDISVRYSDRRQGFFYRFADQYSKPSSVASKVVSMIVDYDEFHRNMCRNQYGQNEPASTDLYVLQR
ncbi:MAG TPA: hypothetical protein VK508_02300 [Cyclobacteriaceae bacterium]|nr:hypothetical protein [Cyclobacteriaceae bacterium]